MDGPQQPEEELAYGRGGRLRDIGPGRWAGLVIVAAVVASATWYFNRSDHGLVVTTGGRAVGNSAEVLRGADAAFARYVRTHSGSVSARSRCYFDRVGGRSRTDVSPDLFCGPVLFYGGAAPALYLRYLLAASDTAANGHARLDVEPEPESAKPDRVPAAAHLERPDGRRPPAGADGLVAPPPAPAAAGTLVAVRQTDVPRLRAAPATSIIGGRDLQVALKASGVIPFYGRGVNARSAPRGGQLVAFRLELSQGDVLVQATSVPIALGLSIDGGPARPLPLSVDAFDIDYSAATTTWFVVAAVPARPRSVDLVVGDAGTVQRMSILTGSPAAGNIAVLSRPGSARYGRAIPVRTALAAITSGGTPSTAALEVAVSDPYLGYYSPYGPHDASGIDRALLNVAVTYHSPRFPCRGAECYPAFEARNLTLVPTEGRALHAYDAGGGYEVFDVPASFRTGTLILAGSASPAESWTVTLVHPYRAPISFPG
jgi:hypothetical protein